MPHRADSAGAWATSSESYRAEGKISWVSLIYVLLCMKFDNGAASSSRYVVGHLYRLRHGIFLQHPLSENFMTAFVSEKLSRMLRASVSALSSTSSYRLAHRPTLIGNLFNKSRLVAV